MVDRWSEGDDIYSSATLRNRKSPSTGLDTGHDGSEVRRAMTDDRIAHFTKGVQDHNKAKAKAKQGRLF